MKNSIKDISKKLVKEIKDHKDEIMWFGVGVVVTNMINQNNDIHQTVFIFAEKEDKENK